MKASQSGKFDGSPGNIQVEIILKRSKAAIFERFTLNLVRSASPGNDRQRICIFNRGFLRLIATTAAHRVRSPPPPAQLVSLIKALIRLPYYLPIWMHKGDLHDSPLVNFSLLLFSLAI